MGNHSASGTGSLLLVLLGNPGDAGSWSAFVDRYAPKIYGWCRRLGLQEADAEDVTQEVLTQLVRKLRTFAYDPQKGSFRGWLKTLTHHAWCDYLDKRRRAGVADTSPEVSPILERLEGREDLATALAEVFDLELLAEAEARVQLQVSARDWKIFQVLAVEGRPGPDLAAELGMTVTAVLMAKSRVQQKLRQEVQRLEGTNRD
jgi:RNA polymerase sigma factor (sigma-70 family)